MIRACLCVWVIIVSARGRSDLVDRNDRHFVMISKTGFGDFDSRETALTSRTTTLIEIPRDARSLIHEPHTVIVDLLMVGLR